jgi:predicted regulator of Ras-like GTPase activity (Roadblock/LC7/MglB family)
VFAKELREQISGLTMIGIFSADGTALAVECVQEKYDSGMLGVMVAALYSMVKRASSIVRLGDMIMTTIEAFESTMIIRKTKTGEMLVGVLSADGAIGDFKKALDENV